MRTVTSDTAPQDRTEPEEGSPEDLYLRSIYRVVFNEVKPLAYQGAGGMVIAARAVGAPWKLGLIRSAGEEDGSLRSNASGSGASVSFAELVDWVARLEVTVKPVNGVITVTAESMAEAIGDFLHANGIEVSHE